MKPIYKITVNGSELNIGKHLISLRISDESGIKSDTCEISLADGNSVFEIPKTGAKLSVCLNKIENATLFSILVQGKNWPEDGL